MSTATIDKFLATYATDRREVITINARDYEFGRTPFMRVKHGEYEVVLDLMALDGHLCLDVHPFVDGEDSTASAFGMTEGRRVALGETGTTSHGWPSARLMSVLIGKQAETTTEETP